MSIVCLVTALGGFIYFSPPQKPRIKEVIPVVYQDLYSKGQFADTTGKPNIYPKVKALLANRFENLASLKKTVSLTFFKQYSGGIFSRKRDKVELLYKSEGNEISSTLESGIRQDDFIVARDGDFLDKLNLLANSPFAVKNRSDLNKIYKLSRRRGAYFGEGDVAFFDLAQSCVKNICTKEVAFLSESDSSEKGYLNTFNHFTAQALISTLFTETLADFVADVHERQNMPELVTGNFSSKQLIDPNNNPIDNYVDLINNELGQKMGVLLQKKYLINQNTVWTAQLLSDYLNDIQNYYSWSFHIGMKPFSAEDEVIIRFSDKINIVLNGVPFEEII